MCKRLLLHEGKEKVYVSRWEFWIVIWTEFKNFSDEV